MSDFHGVEPIVMFAFDLRSHNAPARYLRRPCVDWTFVGSLGEGRVEVEALISQDGTAGDGPFLVSKRAAVSIVEVWPGQPSVIAAVGYLEPTENNA